MIQAFRTLLHRVLEPPILEDERQSEAAAANLLIAVIVLCVVVPGLLGLAAAVPELRPLLDIATVWLVVGSSALYTMTRRGWVTAASGLFLVGVWVVIAWSAWLSGGMFSASMFGQFVAVAIAEVALGWRWSLPLSVVAFLTMLAYTLAGSSGLTPESVIPVTSTTYGATAMACLLALAGVQGVLASRSRMSQNQVRMELRERQVAERRLRELVDHAPFGAFLCEANDAGALQVMHANLSASVALGKEASQFVGGDVTDAFAVLADEESLGWLRESAADGAVEPRDITMLSEGDPRVLEMHAFETEPGRIAVFFTDVTQKRQAEAEIQRIAFHDELTRLPNRKLLLDRLGVALEGAKRRWTGIGLLFIDLDEFKAINDSHGHAFGDLALVAVGERLAAIARASDTVARIGGDEFVVLIQDVNERAQAEAIAEKIVAAFGKPFDIEGESVLLTASVGVTVSSDHEVDPNMLVEYADMAMYEMKQAGRNGYRVK